VILGRSNGRPIATGQLDREMDNAPVCYAARPPVACKVDPFRDIIAARLAEFPELSAVRLLENAEFMRFAAHWDFRVRACRR
jgi:hypothetical protein